MAKKFVRTTKEVWDNQNDKSQYNNSIVFIEDSKLIWSNDVYYGDNQLIEITYNDLKILRDNSQLIPGMLYRITDYITTTTQEGTKSAGHQFDIIVTADSENVLNENARAIQHESEGGDYNVLEYGDKLGEDFFVEWGIETEPNTGIDTLCIYKTDYTGLDPDSEIFNPDYEGTDYVDVFFYKGNYEYNGESFDVWLKCETHRDGYLIQEGSYHYYLTTPIVENGLIKPELYDSDTLLFYEPFDAEYVLLVDNSQIWEFNTKTLRDSDYFSNSNLNAWELKYCLDNDSNRFFWMKQLDNSNGITYIPILYSLTCDGDEYNYQDGSCAFPSEYNRELSLNCWLYNDTTTSPDVFVYVDRFELDGNTYDRWEQNIEYEIEGTYTQYILTPIITNELGTDFLYDNFTLQKLNILPEYIIQISDDDSGEETFYEDVKPEKHVFLAHFKYNDELCLLKGQKDYLSGEQNIVKIDNGQVYIWEGLVTLDGETFDSWHEFNLLSTDYGYSNLIIYTKVIVDTNTNEISEELLINNNYIVNEEKEELLHTGVIYYMKDEYNNECPYDFKNIQFVRTAEWFSEHEDWCNNVIGYVPEENRYYYTFTYVDENGTVHDSSIIGNTLYNDEGYISGVYDNVIKNCSSYSIFNDHPDSLFILPDNILYTTGVNGEYWGCHTNTFGLGCFANTFGTNCYSNTFGNNCRSNTFGDNCFSNTFGENCFSNTFGENCSYNTFGVTCHFNTFGNNCYSNTFGENCNSNTFGENCNSNTFGENCSYNTFGDICNSNTFGNNCRSNTFGFNCDYNTFGESCCNIKLITTNKYTEDRYRYYRFASGLKGLSEDDMLEITLTPNLEYETKVAKRTNGEIVMYNEADLVPWTYIDE